MSSRVKICWEEAEMEVIEQLQNVSWETVIVSAEIAGAASVSLWLMHRKIARDVLVLGGDDPTFVSMSPLVQPRGWWSTAMLLYFRVAVTAFYIVVQCYDVYHTSFRCLAFYTSWNFTAQGVYFGIAAWRTFTTRSLHDNRPAVYTELIDENVSFLRANTMTRGTRRGWHRLDLVLDVCLSTSLLIGVVVWTILYPYVKKIGHPEALLNWVSYSQHAINIVLLQIDFMASRHSVSFDALALVIAWPTTYCIFTWILHGTIKHGFWPYPFLKLDTPWAPFWYGGLLLAHLAAFVGMLYLSRCKLEPTTDTDVRGVEIKLDGAESALDEVG